MSGADFAWSEPFAHVSSNVAAPDVSALSSASLFSHPAYHRLTLTPDERVLLFQTPVASLAGVAAGNRFECGRRAPMGGIDCPALAAEPERLEGFLDESLAWLAGRGIRSVRVLARPDYFGANEPVVVFGLLNRGFRVAAAELSLGIPLPAGGSIESYEERLRSNARRALRHARGLGLSFVTAAEPDKRARCMALLAENRAARGVRLKIDAPYVERLMQAIPGRIHMFALEAGGQPVAAALVYRILETVGYVAAWGDAGHALPHSPMNLLAYEVVRWAIGQRWTLLDLGVSSVDGRADTGLVRFKRSVGAVSGVRLSLALDGD